jgi:hypothetical protein
LEAAPAAGRIAPALPAHFFSARVDPKCVVTQPQDGGYVDLAALCLRDEG